MKERITDQLLDVLPTQRAVYLMRKLKFLADLTRLQTAVSYFPRTSTRESFITFRDKCVVLKNRGGGSIVTNPALAFASVAF